VPAVVCGGSDSVRSSLLMARAQLFAAVHRLRGAPLAFYISRLVALCLHKAASAAWPRGELVASATRA